MFILRRSGLYPSGRALGRGSGGTLPCGHAGRYSSCPYSPLQLDKKSAADRHGEQGELSGILCVRGWVRMPLCEFDFECEDVGIRRLSIKSILVAKVSLVEHRS